MAPPLSRAEYTVGWVTALSIELAAAQEMLDVEHERLPQPPNDTNLYSYGSIGEHNVVIACLPAGQTGIGSATASAMQMKSSFQSIRFGLMVGVGGGVPGGDEDIRLGDVVAKHTEADKLKQVHDDILCTEAHASLLVEYRKDKTALSTWLREVVENKVNLTYKSSLQAMDKYAHLRTIFDPFAAGYSVILTPSAEDVAPQGLGDMGASIFNFLWTGLHAPVIHVPAFVGEGQMPVGLSIVAGRYRDQHALKVAGLLSKMLMAEGGWEIKEPSSRL